MAGSARKRYEIFVRTRMSPAALARLRIALTPTTVPGNRVHRLRVRGDRDIADVVHTLIERDIELLELRRRTEWVSSSAGEPSGADVIVPFPAPRDAPPSPAITGSLAEGPSATV